MKIYKNIADDLLVSLKAIEPTANSIGTFRVIASTSKRDRHGESIKQDGWDLDNYLKNPVILADHNWSVEKIVGKATNISFEGDQMIVEGEFADTTLGREVKYLYEAGFLKAVSVGLIPRTYDAQYSSIITTAELLELSFVTIPANPEALRKMKSLGLSGEMIEKADESNKEMQAIESIKADISEIKSLLITLADGKAKEAKDFEAKEALQNANRAISDALRTFKAKP